VKLRALGLLVVLGAAAEARAQPAPEALGPAAPEALGPAAAEARVGPAAADCAARVRFIDDSLRRAARPARVWSWTWGLGYFVVGGAQLGIAPFLEDEGRQADFYVGGGRTLLAALPFVLLPLATMKQQRTLSARVAALPPDADLCAELPAAERALERSAASEQRGKSLLKHTIVAVLNLGAGLILGLGYDRWATGAFTAGSGILVGEIMIWTQPTRSVHALRKYRAGHYTAAAPSVSWGIAPTLLPEGGAGVGLIVVF
jgi:hypothetical protein